MLCVSHILTNKKICFTVECLEVLNFFCKLTDHRYHFPYNLVKVKAKLKLPAT